WRGMHIKAGWVAPDCSPGLCVQSINAVVLRSEIKHSVNHGRRGKISTRSCVVPFLHQPPNILSVEDVLIRIPARHVGTMELGPSGKRRIDRRQGRTRSLAKAESREHQ